MWTGSGPREVRQQQRFAGLRRTAGFVKVGISMWDIDHQTNSRIDISAENVTATGFEIVFRTWADTRIARIRADWIAIGPARAGRGGLGCGLGLRSDQPVREPDAKGKDRQAADDVDQVVSTMNKHRQQTWPC